MMGFVSVEKMWRRASTKRSCTRRFLTGRSISRPKFRMSLQRAWSGNFPASISITKRRYRTMSVRWLLGFNCNGTALQDSAEDRLDLFALQRLVKNFRDSAFTNSPHEPCVAMCGHEYEW